MKLSASNIAWDHAHLIEYLDLVRQSSCTGVELAPSKIWKDPIQVDIKEQKKMRELFESHKLKLVGFHALLYGLPHLQMFSTDENSPFFLDYLKRLTDLCSNLGGKLMIFGSPNNRKLNGFSYEDCLIKSKKLFNELATYCESRDIIFCIEPLAKKDCEFITTLKEGGKLVKEVGHPNLGLHIDTKTLHETNEDLNEIIMEFGSAIKHFHISDPGLVQLGLQGVNHDLYGNILRRHDYEGFLSLEMRKSELDPRGALKASLNFMKEKYLNEETIDRWK